jgi:hypothetical protein
MESSDKRRKTNKNFKSDSNSDNNNHKKAKHKLDSKNKAKDLLTIVDGFIGRHTDIIFLLSLVFTIVFSILLFDLKISEGGDDSDYILGAKKFLEGTQFPYWHGSFYPIFLGIVLLIFGFNVAIFKIFSFLFIILHLIFFYYALKKRVSPTLLSLTILIAAVNSNLLYYSSQTYSEAIYLFLQAVIIYVFLNINDNLDKKPYKLSEHWKSWLLFGFLALLLSTTRTVGYSMLMAVIFYLLIRKQFYAILYAFVSYLVFAIPYNIYKWVVWDIIPGKSGGGRFEMVLYKNVYNKAAGTEDFAGMVTRFIENSKIYLSKHFFIITGLKDPGATETSGFLTILMYALFLIAFIYALKKSKTILFIASYLAFSVGITFITLQQTWGQERLILVYVPLILILFSWGIYQFIISVNKHTVLVLLSLFIAISQFFIKYSLIIQILVFITFAGLAIILLIDKKTISAAKTILQLALIFIFLVIIFNTLGHTAERIKLNRKELAKNIRGNLYYGFTPDWVNFLKMSEWVGKNIPDSIAVASRKPSMSFIYSKGKEFYPIFRVPMENADTLINKLKEKYNNLCTIEYSEFNKKKMPMPVQMNFRLTNLAYIGKGNESYGIYRIRDNYKDAFYNALDQYNIDYIQEIDIFLNKIRNKNYFGVSPDTLLNKLKENNVDYVIVGSLRINPRMKTNRTLNAVRRFLYYIELKYPGTFTLVYQEGENDKEPAYLYKVNYNKYHIGN